MTIVMAIVLILGVVLLGELVLRFASHALPQPQTWHDDATHCKEAQVEVLRKRGGVDVVFVGTSMMLFSVDPAVVNEKTGLRTYNASIFRSIPSVSRMWLRDVVLPRLRPRLVVVGLSAFDLNDNGLLATRHDEYLAAPRFRYGRVRRALLMMGRRSYIARYAPLAKRPRTLVSSVLRGLRKPQPLRRREMPTLAGLLGPLGQGLEFQDREYAEMPRMTDLIRQQAVQDWEDRGVQRQALRQIVEDVRAHGGETVFLEMPVTKEFTRFFVGGARNWRAVTDRLVAEARSWGVHVMTLEDHSDRSYFADMIHMNGAGRSAFSTALARELHDTGIVSRLKHAGGTRVRPRF